MKSAVNGTGKLAKSVRLKGVDAHFCPNTLFQSRDERWTFCRMPLTLKRLALT